MAQLNDLLVLGNTSLIGEAKFNSDIIAPQLILETQSGEGGQIQLKTALNDTTNSGVVIDTANGDFRVFGLPSRNGSTRTGNGTIFTIDPYDKTLSGGYSVAGTLAVNDKTYLKNNIELTNATTKTNPWIGFKTDGTILGYVQLNGTSMGIGNGWGNSLQIDNTGNATLPGDMTAKKFIGPLQGNANTATSALQLAGWADTRSIATAPNDYNGVFKVVGIKQKSLMDIDGSSYSSLIGFRGWSDSSGGNSHELAFTGNGNLYHRHGATTTWGAWNRIPMCGTANTFNGTNTFNAKVTVNNSAYIRDLLEIAGNKPSTTTYKLYVNGNARVTHLSADSISWGFQTQTSPNGESLAGGRNTYAYGDESVSEGNMTMAYGKCSHASGYGHLTSLVSLWGPANTTTYDYSVASGDVPQLGNAISCWDGTKHLSTIITSIDYNNYTLTVSQTLNPSKAFDSAAGEMGTLYTNVAAGEGSFTAGISNVARGKYTCALGNHTYAIGDGQVTVGKYNAIDTNTIYSFIVGSGTSRSNRKNGLAVTLGGDVHMCNGKIYTLNNVLYGAAWNDYAEYRAQKEKIESGYCVASANNGEVYKTTEKFQACDGIVSDTFGFAIGETDNCKIPLAVAGRVLAYYEGNRYDYNAGDTVCAGPNGKVCKMTREEIKEYPDRIIGIVSEIPEYEEWGAGKIKVNNRIWIKVK